MKKPNLQNLLFLVFIVFVLIGSGCGGGSNTGKNAPDIGGSVSGYGIDGLIINGDVYIYSYNGSRGSLLAQSKTDAKGQFSAQIGNYSGPILIEVRNGYYVEEASGYRVDLNVGDYLSAVTFYSAGGSLSNVMVTPLTTLAASLAGYYQGAGDNVSNAINKANTAMSSLILLNILDTYPADLTDDKNKPGSLTNSAMYGVVLAGLSQMSADISAQNNTQPHRVYNSMALTKALANDISDGKINGKKVADDIFLGITKLDSYTMRRTLGVAAINFMNTTYNKSGLARGDVEGYLSQIAANSGSLFPSENAPLPIDDVAPTIAITEPAQGVYVSKMLRLRIVATDFSNIKALTVTSPSFPNTIFFDYDSTANVYLLEVDTTTIADGNLTFNVSATDVADNTSTASLAVVVDNTRPQINITSPLSGTFTSLAVVPVTGTITDAGSGVAAINFVRGSQSTAATITGNSFTANLATGADAQYDYTVNVTDLVGNQLSSIYILMKDTVPPYVVYTSGNTAYYDEAEISATVDPNTRVVSYNKVTGRQPVNLQDINMVINKYITRLSSGNSFIESVLNWNLGGYDYNIPYYKFTASDQGSILTLSAKLVVTYNFSQRINNAWVEKRAYATTPTDGNYYIVPISTEYLGSDLATVDNTVENRVTVRIVDEAGNVGYRNFYFKMNLLGPPVIIAHDPTLSINSSFTKSDSLYIYNYGSRFFAIGRNLKALGVVIDNPNPVTVYVDPRNVSGSVTVNKKVIAARAAVTNSVFNGCQVTDCQLWNIVNYGGEYASKDYTYTINSVYGYINGFRDAVSQQLIAKDAYGYYPLLPGQAVIGYGTFDNYGYPLYNSGVAWNWKYGGAYDTGATPPEASGAAEICASNSVEVRCSFTSVPQGAVVDDYRVSFGLSWSDVIYTGPYIPGVNSNNLVWNAPYSSSNMTMADWTRTPLGTCTQHIYVSIFSGGGTRVCEDLAVNNVNTTSAVQGALP
jgi:hypothetical protein